MKTGLTGRVKVLVRGNALERLNESGKPFALPMPDGTTEKLFVLKTFPDPAPQVRFRDKTIQIARPLKWWEWAIGGAPLLFVIKGGALGSLVGGAATAANLFILRGSWRPPAKILSVLAVSLIPVGLYAALFLAVHILGPRPMFLRLADVPARRQRFGLCASCRFGARALFDVDSIIALRGFYSARSSTRSKTCSEDSSRMRLPIHARRIAGGSRSTALGTRRRMVKPRWMGGSRHAMVAHRPPRACASAYGNTVALHTRRQMG